MSAARDEAPREREEQGARPEPPAGDRRRQPTRLLTAVVVLLECAWLAGVTLGVWWLATRI